jgi:hypothetical protein
MRSRINAVVFLAAAFIAFTAVSSAKGVQISGHPFPTAVLTDGGGPMCFPSIGCGYKDGVSASGTDLPAEILLATGPGPMCFPDTGCGYREGVTANEPGNPDPLLLADGTGPMCPPHTGCGHEHSVLAARGLVEAALAIDSDQDGCFSRNGCGYETSMGAAQMHLPRGLLLTDGTGPMCPPTSGCGNGNVRSDPVLHVFFEYGVPIPKG